MMIYKKLPRYDSIGVIVFATSRQDGGKKMDQKFFDELRKIRRDYRICPAKKTNDIQRRRIVKLVLNCFLTYHPLQHSLPVNDFQMLSSTLESAIYGRLQNLKLICKEPLEEEIRLVKEAKMSQSRHMFKSEAQQWALKLNCESQDLELDAKGKLLIDEIMQILKGGKNDVTGRTEIGNAFRRKINDDIDVNGVVRL